LLHGKLMKQNQYAFGRSRLFEIIDRPGVVPLAVKAASLFLARHNIDAPIGDAEFADRCAELRGEIERQADAEDAKAVLNGLVDCVESVLKTNVNLEDRCALAMRLNPELCGYNEDIGTTVPYGTFFVHGRWFNGFHVRFRDISRGGLRVVAPSKSDQHAVESARQYDEAYSLAFAQQLKNKDIPEGGSKAVCLIDPAETESLGAHAQSEIYNRSRKAVKCFSDAILDLTSILPEVTSNIVDLNGRPELIYLGPDENVIPSDITWMIQRAHLRGYPIPNAFMSSKPDAGINHKVYGVTSEGVNVFLDEALQSRGLDPRKEAFTVKVTGGPDGDVGGNMLAIMHREYGDNVKLVGICDGTGTIEDPAGIDMQEMLRLFKEELPLCDFKGSLGAEGKFLTVDSTEGVYMRNTMHNRVKADVFVPAGGRPATINESNWRDFLDEDGNPTSPLIVEGANLFTTPAARAALFENAGVVIVKDSSANKCGVVCSSYEIITCMMASPEEFIEIKNELVADVVARLKDLARMEAQLMLKEYGNNSSIAPPVTSARISDAITRVHDAISAKLQDAPQSAIDELLVEVAAQHMPAKLHSSFNDRINRIPKAYLIEMIACSLSSRLVYNEGLDFCEGLPDNMVASTGLSYAKQQQEVADFAEMVGNSNIEGAAASQIRDLLMRGGARPIGGDAW
jgi:glutamate dehydrogenase